MILRSLATIVLLGCLSPVGAQAQVAGGQIITGPISQIGALSSLTTAYSGSAQVAGGQINTNSLNQMGSFSASMSLIPANGSLSQIIGGATPTAVTQSAINIMQAHALTAQIANASASLTGDQIASGTLNVAAVASPLSAFSFNQTLNTSTPSSLTASNLLSASALNGAATINGNGNRQVSSININDVFTNTTLGGVFTLSQSAQGAMNMTAGNVLSASSVSGRATIQ